MCWGIAAISNDFFYIRGIMNKIRLQRAQLMVEGKSLQTFMWVEPLYLMIVLPFGLSSDQSFLWFVSEKQFDMRGFLLRIDMNYYDWIVLLSH